MPPAKNTLIALLISAGVGLAGAIPFAILGLIFGGADVARDIYILEALILGSWLPLKTIIDTQVKGQSTFRIPDIRLNSLSVFIVMVGFMIVIPILYFATFTAFLVGALLYSFAGNNLLLALVAGLFVQIANIYRGSLREKAMGTHNNIFMRVQDFSQSGFNVEIDPSQVRQQTPREDEPQVIYLPEDNLRDRSEDDLSDEQPMTINIDPDSVSEQFDDET